ncbi:MAG: hypothetical protein J0I49_00850 [Pseudonocardia sp.]|nr:hypothetical protein [Pseudonocardia sp.]
MYDALSRSRVEPERIRRTLASLPLPRATDGRMVLAVDVSQWLRSDAPLVSMGGRLVRRLGVAHSCSERAEPARSSPASILADPPVARVVAAVREPSDDLAVLIEAASPVVARPGAGVPGRKSLCSTRRPGEHEEETVPTRRCDHDVCHHPDPPLRRGSRTAGMGQLRSAAGRCVALRRRRPRRGSRRPVVRCPGGIERSPAGGVSTAGSGNPPPRRGRVSATGPRQVFCRVRPTRMPVWVRTVPSASIRPTCTP